MIILELNKSIQNKKVVDVKWYFIQYFGTLLKIACVFIWTKTCTVSIYAILT